MFDGHLSAIIEIIQRVGNIQTLDPDQDFYDAGFTSVQALPLLMEMEDQFQVSIPDDSFVNARTPRALDRIITDLKKG